MGFDLYVFFLCFIVFSLLTVLLGGMLAVIIKLTVKLIRGGLEDDRIKTEYLSAKAKGRKMGCFDTVVSLILSLVFLGFFGFSLYVNLSQDTYFENIPTLKVVNSASMAKKNEKNTYLFENNLNDQFATFDMLLTYKLPEEDELKLYDIVVYEVDDIYVVHRIVAIEEPNPSHPNFRYFLCQGDAVESPDRFPVYYSQMRAIYRGERIPFVGSFVTFMQSPAGWLCVLLIIASLIGTPILEKKVGKEKMRRLVEIGVLNADGSLYEPSPFDHLRGRINTRTFDQALSAAGEEMQIRYARLTSYLSRFEGIRLIESKTRRTYKCKNIPIVRFSVRGKTVNANIALPSLEYATSKYIYDDCSSSSEFRFYPMRVRLTSERMTRWTIELFDDIAERFGITILDEEMPIPSDIIEDSTAVELLVEKERGQSAPQSPFAHLAGRINTRTFDQALDAAGRITQDRYERIVAFVSRFVGVRVIESRLRRTYKVGSIPIVRLSVRGKTLNAYLALNPDEYAETKYIYENYSDRSNHRLYPMRIRVSSERMTRWTIELLDEIAKKRGITVSEEAMPNSLGTICEQVLEEIPTVPVSRFAHLVGKRDNRNFNQRLSDAPHDTQLRYAEISARLNSIRGVRVIESKRARTYKVGSVPVVRLTVRGKTLNAYLALNPERFLGTKYIFTDTSATKKFERYPMRVRVSSERQKRYVLELITLLCKESELTVGGDAK